MKTTLYDNCNNGRKKTNCDFTERKLSKSVICSLLKRWSNTSVGSDQISAWLRVCGRRCKILTDFFPNFTSDSDILDRSVNKSISSK